MSRAFEKMADQLVAEARTSPPGRRKMIAGTIIVLGLLTIGPAAFFTIKFIGAIIAAG